jgi:hypothetical protein
MSDVDLLRRARAAIASQDEPAALQLLRELAEGDSQANLLAQPVGDALIATARGSRRDAADRAALTKLRRIEQTRNHVIQLLDSTPFGSADLAAIREAVGALEARAQTIKIGATAAEGAHCFGARPRECPRALVAELRDGHRGPWSRDASSTPRARVRVRNIRRTHSRCPQLGG